MTPKQLAELIEHVVEHALDIADHNDPDLLDVYSWPQVWGNTACGFGGMAGQGITSAQTVVVLDTLYYHYHVYHNGRHAYTIKRPTDKFFEDFHNHRLKGRIQDWLKEYEGEI